MNSFLIIGRLIASFLETSSPYPPLLKGEGVEGELQAERTKRPYAQVWYNTHLSNLLLDWIVKVLGAAARLRRAAAQRRAAPEP